jgi:hypothetical protein
MGKRKQKMGWKERKNYKQIKMREILMENNRRETERIKKLQ